MADDKREEQDLYNLEGGQRHLVIKNGRVKAVAPGLRIVEATEEEKKLVEKPEEEEPREYGLPV